jgi:hypothetical protein
MRGGSAEGEETNARARVIELSSWAAAIVSIVVLIAIVGGLRFRLMLQKALTPRRAFNGRGNERC